MCVIIYDETLYGIDLSSAFCRFEWIAAARIQAVVMNKIVTIKG